MKKKFSFAIVIVLLVSMLTLVLVACDPKDPESFSAVDSMTVLEEIWDAWSVDNFQTATDTLGIDVNVNLKGEGKDINFVLQGGISSNASVKEGLRLAIVNNFANKTIAEVISNSDGTFVYADGLNDKPLKINEIKFQGIGSIINETLGFSVGDLAGLLKMPIINLVNDAINMEGSCITVRPVLKEKSSYDVNYTFDFKLNSLIDGLMSFIPGSEEIFESVKAELNDVSIYFDIKTAGNQREKVVKPAKGRSVIHHAGAGKQALRSEVGAVASQLIKIVKIGISVVGPAVGIVYRRLAVIGAQSHRENLLFSLNYAGKQGKVPVSSAPTGSRF